MENVCFGAGSAFRTKNIKLILDIVMSKGEHSKRDIAASSGLSPKTVSSIIEYLLDKGAIIEKASERHTVGRPAGVYAPNTETLFLALDLSHDDLYAEITNASMQRLMSYAYHPQRGLSYDENWRRFLSSVKSRSESILYSHSLSGVCAAVSSEYDTQLREFEIRQTVDDYLGVRVDMFSECTDAAIKSWQHKFPDCASGVTAYLYVGEGVDSAIFVDGTPLIGKNGRRSRLGLSMDSSLEILDSRIKRCVSDTALTDELARAVYNLTVTLYPQSLVLDIDVREPNNVLERLRNVLYRVYHLDMADLPDIFIDNARKARHTAKGCVLFLREAWCGQILKGQLS